jgi:sporulation protein YlmC with PRC-barrel domain
MKRHAFIAIALSGALPLLAQQQESTESQSQQSQKDSSQQQQQQQQPSEKSQQELKVSEQDVKKQVTDANKASKLMGMQVKNKQDEDLGKVKDLVVDFQSGKIAYAVISAGGTFGIGGKMVAVPIQALTLQPGAKALLLDLPKQQLTQAQGFNEQSWPDLNAAEKGQTIGLSSSAQGSSGSQPQKSSGSSEKPQQQPPEQEKQQ